MRNFSRDNTFGRKDNRRDNREDRQMHRATCAECGRDCEVPFRPSGDKPVYCSNCFKKDSNPRDDRGRGRDDYRGRGRDDRDRDRDGDRGRGRDRQVMHKAICSNCGKSCEVPFRPSSDKPIYCDYCFGKGDNSALRKPPVQSNDKDHKKHDEINAKLDKILDLLQRMNPFKEATVIKPKDKEDSPKKPAVKPEVKLVAKPVAKKATKKAPAKKVAKKKATPKLSKKA